MNNRKKDIDKTPTKHAGEEVLLPIEIEIQPGIPRRVRAGCRIRQKYDGLAARIVKGQRFGRVPDRVFAGGHRFLARAKGKRNGGPQVQGLSVQAGTYEIRAALVKGG